MKQKVVLSKYLKKIFETESKDFSEWFGYYNYDTLNHNQTKMLACRISTDGKAPIKGQTICVGYYDLKIGNWKEIGKTDSWNWQQGAMAQWLPGEGNENRIIFNASKDNRIISVIHDIETNDEKVIDYPIYGIIPDGTKSISLDLERSYWCRAYHYQSVINREKDGLVWADDGIFVVDLLNNTRKTIISIDAIIQTDCKYYFKGCKHWLEHVMINPSGTKICFLHRFSSPENVLSYSTRLFVSNIDGSNLKVIPGWEDTIYTHFGWKTDNEFAIYTYTPYKMKEGRGFRELIKDKAYFSRDMLRRTMKAFFSAFPYSIKTKIIGRRMYYQFYQLDENNVPHASGKAEGRLFSVDGHPSFTADGRYMITDSYPWKDGYQRLMVFNTVTGKSLVLALLNAYYRGNPASCDLHPKLCTNNRYLSLDTAYDARHHMLLFEIDWNLIESVIS